MTTSVKKVLSVLLSAALLFGVTPLNNFVGLRLPFASSLFSVEANAMYSGACGENLTWVYDPNTLTLTISGTGAMTSAPWGTYAADIQTVVIENNVTSICDLAFNHCSSLTDVTIGSGVTSIGEWAFANCADLTSVVIPDSVTSVENYAFYQCAGLTSVLIGNGVDTIGECAFQNCTGLTNLTIGDHVMNIEDYGFTGCTSLLSVTVPDSVIGISGGAFDNCSNLASVTIGNSVVSIGFGSFYECSNLSDVYYNGTQQEWDAITIDTDNDPLLNATRHLHEHAYTANVTTPATCTQDGVMTYTCTCGDSYTETIPAHGHTTSEWQMAEDPTPTSTGRMCRYCTECHILLDEMTVPILAGTHVTGIALTPTEAYLNMGETLTLTADVTPATATDKTVLWTSSKPTVATVENGVVTPVAPGITVIIAQTADCGYKDFCVVQVNAVTPQNGAIIDNGMIYGLSVNMTSLDNCLTLSDDAMSLEASADVIGTGTKIFVKQGDTVVNEFEAVIFGDVDGNSWYDGTDACFVNLVANGMVSPDALTDAQRMACDVNHDGVIDEADAAIVEQAGLLLASIDQTAPQEELQPNSVYLAYCGLIDQTVEEAAQIIEAPQEAAEQESVIARILRFFRAAYRWLFNLIFVKVF